MISAEISCSQDLRVQHIQRRKKDKDKKTKQKTDLFTCTSDMESACYSCHMSGKGPSRGGQPGAMPAAKTSFPMEASPQLLPGFWSCRVVSCGREGSALDWT